MFYGDKKSRMLKKLNNKLRILEKMYLNLPQTISFT